MATQEEIVIEIDNTKTHRPIILLIEDLPTATEADLPGCYPKLSVIPGYYDEVYGPVLQKIFNSPIYKNGKIGNVYVQFPTEGWFKIEPEHAEFWVRVTKDLPDRDLMEATPIEAMFAGLFGNDVVWSRIPTITEEVTKFPANTHIIGCYVGVAAYNVGAKPLKDFIPTMLDDHTYAFVNRVHCDNELMPYIEHKLEVSTGAWMPAVCKLLDELSKKWNVGAN